MKSTTIAILALAVVVLFLYYRAKQRIALAAAGSAATPMPSKNIVLKAADYAMTPSDWLLREKLGTEPGVIGVAGREANALLNGIPENVTGGNWTATGESIVTGGLSDLWHAW